MQQSNSIFAFLFFAFLFFITARGELRKYMGFLIGTPTNANTAISATNIINGAAALAKGIGAQPLAPSGDAGTITLNSSTPLTDS